MLFILTLLAIVPNAYAQVDFTASVTQGCSPLIVNFTATAPGATGYSWSFGNGTSSTLPAPGVTYTTGGQFTVSLTVSFADGSTATETKAGYIQTFAPPVPDFAGAPLTLCSGETVNFTNQSQPGDGAILAYTWDLGDGTTSNQVNPAHVYQTPGVLTVTLIADDVNGCTALDQKTAYVQVNQTPSADFVVNNTLGCTTPFTAQFTTISPVPGTSHSWTFGNGSTAITSSPSTTYTNNGTYTVTHIVSDPIGCADTVTKTNLIQVGGSAVNVQVNANPVCVGTGVIFNCGAAPGAAVNWTFGNGQTSNNCNPTVTYANPGTYTVTVTIVNPDGCQFNSSLPVTVHPRPAVDFTVSDTLLCEDPHTVSFTSTGSVGTSYNWNYGDNSTGSGPNPTHTYPTLPYSSSTGQPYNWDVTLSVTNQFGCSASRTKTSYVTTGRTRARISGIPRNGCAPLTVDFFDASQTPSTITSYTWDFGDGSPVSNDPNPTHTYLDTGFYDVQLIITTVHGCTDTLTLSDYIAIGDTPVADFLVDTTYACASRAIEFTNLSINADSAYWIFGDGTQGSVWEPTRIFQDTGYMDVTLIAFDRGCPDTLTIDSLVYIDPPIAKFSPPILDFCELPATIDFLDFSIGADTYAWDFGDGSPISTQASPTHTYTAEGTYPLELIVNNLSTGCADTISSTVRVELIEADFVVDTTFGCSPVSVKFIDSSYNAIEWLWQFGNGSTSAQSNPTQTYGDVGRYSVSLFAKNSLGCIDDTTFTDLISVYEPQVAFVAVPDDGCAPLDVTFTNNTTSLAPVVSWQWTFGPVGAGSTQESPSYTYTQAGSWPVSLTATDSIGCQNSVNQNNAVFVTRPVANFFADFPVNCPNNNVVFTNTSSGSGLNYLWDFGDGNTSGAFSPVHQYANPGTYTVSLTVTDFQGCDSTLVLPSYITIADPQIGLVADTTTADCPPLLVNFTGQALSPHTFTAWNWTFGNGASSTGQSPSHIYANPGTYTVTVKATAGSGCTDSVAVPNLITVNGPTGSFTFAPNSVCPNEPVTFTGTSNNASIFTWDFNNGALGTGQTTTYGYPAAGVYTPLLILEDSVGCQVIVPGQNTITVHPTPTSAFTASNTLFCDSGQVAFTNTSSSTLPVSGLTWDFGSGLGTSTLNNPSFAFTQPGNYDVQLVVTNNQGCADTLLQPGFVTIAASPVAAYALSDTTGCAPFTVTFLDQTQLGSAPINSRLWDFGVFPPASSTQNQPVFQYVNSGTFTTTLTVVDANGCTDSETLDLTALQPPVANFAADDSFGCAPKPIQFTSLTPNAVDWEWTFGDNSPKAFIDDPQHVYLQDGIFTVSMAVTDVQGCKDTLIKPQYINLDRPQANFELSDSVICPGDPLQFTDLSQSDTSLIGWDWTLGDGGTATQQNPSYAYGDDGLYDVRLWVTDFFGCDDSVTLPNAVRVKLDEQPVAPALHYVTVLDGGRIEVAFAPYPNLNRDFGEYRLLRDDGSGAWQVVFSSGQLFDTLFVDPGVNTVTSRYCYRLEVVNHCETPSEPRNDLAHCSMLLEATPLVDAIEVTWNAYQGWPVARYEVYRVTNYQTANVQLVATLPGDVTAWTDFDMFCYDAVTYRVRAVQAGAPWQSWSNIRRAAPLHFGPPFPMHLEVVTVEQDSFLRVRWSDIPPGDNLVQVLIEKDAGNGFQSWHTQSIADSTRERFDFDVQVGRQPYAYQAFVQDTCGDVTPVGRIGRSIYLQATREQGQVFLNWTPYETWENGVERYEVELFEEATQQWQLVEILNGGVDEFVDSQTEWPQGEYCYRIVGYENGGNRQVSVSNPDCITVDPLLYFPSAFTPNQDGTNDRFLIKGVYLQDFRLEIYNRWGELIYVTDNQAEGWDGRVNGVIAQEGVYVYSVLGTGYEGETITRSGTVTLFR